MDPRTLLNTYSPYQILNALQLETYKRHFPRLSKDCLKISPKYVASTGLVPFKLNRAQRVMDRTASRQLTELGRIRMCLLKHRQPGGSTWAAGRAYQLVALTPHTHAMIFAHDDDTAEHILNIVRRFQDNMPKKYAPRVHSRPAGGLVLVDPASPPGHRERRIGSSIFCQTAKTALSGTGHTLQFVQLSECAKYVYPHTLWTSLTPAIPDMPGTTIILESTAYHSGEWFRRMYERARDDEDFEYVSLFTPWFLSEEYELPLRPGERLTYSLEEQQRVREHNLRPEQIKWYRAKLKQLGDDDIAQQLMKQEYPENDEEAWIDLSAGVFDARKLFGYLRSNIRPPRRRCDVFAGPRLLDNPDGLFHIWEEPDVNEFYDIGVDVASGQEGAEFDWSVAHIMKRRTREQVAEWRGKIDPIDFGSLLFQLGLYYNQAQIAVETTGIGFSTNAQLHKLGYPRMYIWRTRGEAVDKLTRFTGWRTGGGAGNEAKNYMVSVARHHLMNEEFIIHSDTLWNEMKAFSSHVTDTGLVGYGASAGYNDDTVMAFMIALIIGDDERVDYDPNDQPKRPEYIDPAFIDDFAFKRGNREADTFAALADMLGR
jgi:hypothetical protein